MLEKLDGPPRIKKFKSVRDEGVDLLFFEQREDLRQILSQRLRVFFVKRANAVEGAPSAAEARADEKVGKHRQFGKNPRGAHKSETDYHSASAQRADTGADIPASDSIEHVIHSLGFKGTREPIQFPLPVVDRRGAKRSNGVMLARRRGGIGLHSSKSQHLKCRRTDPSRGTSYQSRLPTLHIRDAMNHLPGGNVVEDHRCGVTIGNSTRNRQEMFGSTNEKFGKAAVDCQRRHALPKLKAGNTGADCVDLSNGFVAGDERYLRGKRIVAPEHHQIGGSHSRCFDAHAKLTGRRGSPLEAQQLGGLRGRPSLSTSPRDN